jgi:hypothetical protein
MGLSEKVHPIAALCGCVAGLLTTLITYAVGNPGCPSTHPSGFEAGNFEMLLLPGGLYSTTALIAFVLTPLISGLVTALVALPFYLQGYKFGGFPKGEEAPAVKTNTVEITTTSSA